MCASNDQRHHASQNKGSCDGSCTCACGGECSCRCKTHSREEKARIDLDRKIKSLKSSTSHKGDI